MAIVGVFAADAKAGVKQAANAVTETTQQAADAVHLDLLTFVTFLAAALVLVGLFVAKVLRPGALAGRKVDAQPWWVWLMCGLVTFWCGLMGATFIALAPRLTGPGPAHNEEPSLQFQAVTQLAVYVVSLTVAAALIRLLRASMPQAGLTATPRSLLVGAGCLLLAFPVVSAAGDIAILIHQSTSGAALDHVAHPVLKDLQNSPHDGWAWVLAIIAVFLAPVQEEVLFRGFLQTSLLRLTGRPWLAIFIAAAAFGAVHLPSMPWYAVVAISTLGLAMGVAFEKTKTLGAPIAMHVLFNAANVAVVLWAS